MAKTDPRRSGKRRPSAGAAACPSCGTETVDGARFCHSCGAALAPGARRPGDRVLWWGASLVAVLVAVLVTAVLWQGSAPAPAPAPPLPQLPAAAPANTPPDLSQMSPREAADRLFNRVMIADERGNRDEALGFAPMAVSAYAMVPELDRDARYHLALIHLVTGDTEAAKREIAAMREGAPDHLLATIIEHKLAEGSGDRDAAARLRAAFDASYEDEIAQARREYLDHRNVIEGFRASAPQQ